MILTIPFDVKPRPAALNELMWWWYEAVGGGAGGGGPDTNPCAGCWCWYQWLIAWWGCKWGWPPPIPPAKPPIAPKPPLVLSRGFIISPIIFPRDRQDPPVFFFLLLDDSLRLRVWMPSFFIVNGRLTWNNETEMKIYVAKVLIWYDLKHSSHK